MTFYNLMGIIAAIALLFPIILIVSFRLTVYKSFPALLAYYAILLGFNILQIDYFNTGEDINQFYSITNNLLSTPLILLFLTHFSTTAVHKNRLHIAAISYCIYELAIVFIYGYTMEASAIAMGPGLLLLIVFSLVLFIRNTKITIIHQHKAPGKAFVSTALLFAYLGYTFIYVFLYLKKTRDTGDTYLIYFIVNAVSSILMAIGIFFEAKRIKQLEELKTTREELKMLYGEEAETKTAASIEGAVFNFDKEQWN